MEAEGNIPQILKERAAARIWWRWNPQVCISEGTENCVASLRTDKDTGDFGACFWLIAWWGVREVLGIMGEQGSEQECPLPPSPEDGIL